MSKEGINNGWRLVVKLFAGSALLYVIGDELEDAFGKSFSFTLLKALGVGGVVGGVGFSLLLHGASKNN